MTIASYFIAVDWGQNYFRAYLVDPRGVVQRRVTSDDGTDGVRPDQFGQALSAICGTWLSQYPEATILLSGMVGSSQGWVKTAFLPCPAGPDDILAGAAVVTTARGHKPIILPGLSREDEDMGLDVMRGPEIMALGTGLRDGIVCVPGLMSRWIELRGGRIVRFASFMTGDIYTAMRRQSSLAKVKDEDDDHAAFRYGLAMAWRQMRPEGGLDSGAVPIPSFAQQDARGRGGNSLLHKLFRIRASLLAGRMGARQVWPSISGLLIGDEIQDALNLFGRPRKVVLVSEGMIASRYALALAERKIDVETLHLEPCYIGGMTAVARAHQEKISGVLGVAGMATTSGAPNYEGIPFAAL